MNPEALLEMYGTNYIYTTLIILLLCTTYYNMFEKDNISIFGL